MSRKRSKAHEAAATPRPPRRTHEEPPGKLREIAACPDCGASYREGRWTWKTAPADAYPHVCPACERIAKDHPEGVIHVQGAFVASHGDELIGLIRHVEERERTEHPLKRVMAIEEEEGGLVVTLTDGSLASSLGRALHKAYGGDLDQPGTSAEQDALVRIRWSRD